MHEIRDVGDLRKYRTEIPNIVYHLGLTPYELTLYNLLKRTAGANGQCRKSTDTLAVESKMSKGMVSKAKIGLARPRTEIGDQPLIVILTEKNKNGGKPKDVIEISDIWEENMAMFSKRSQVHKVNVQVHGVNVTSSPGEIGNKPSQERTVQEEPPNPQKGKSYSKAAPRREPTPEESAALEVFNGLMDFLVDKVGDLPARGRETKALTWLLERYEPDQLRKHYGYLESQTWRDSPVFWYTMKRTIGVWEKKGEPLTANGHQNGNGYGAGNGKDDYRGPVKDTRTPEERERVYDCRRCNGTGTELVPGKGAKICKHEPLPEAMSA